jgi:hypothetical protein
MCGPCSRSWCTYTGQAAALFSTLTRPAQLRTPLTPLMPYLGVDALQQPQVGRRVDLVRPWAAAASPTATPAAAAAAGSAAPAAAGPSAAPPPGLLRCRALRRHVHQLNGVQAAGDLHKG